MPCPSMLAPITSSASFQRFLFYCRLAASAPRSCAFYNRSRFHGASRYTYDSGSNRSGQGCPRSQGVHCLHELSRYDLSVVQPLAASHEPSGSDMPQGRSPVIQYAPYISRSNSILAWRADCHPLLHNLSFAIIQQMNAV